ncbi:MAG TPA: hypothetical protein VIK85_00190, partial [Coriobacteriia bacterium]
MLELPLDGPPHRPHARERVPHCPPTSCDLGDANACHTRDVIAIHVVAGGPGCAACHAPGVTPTALCTSCHTGDFWGTIHVVGTKHTPPDGTCVTSECHNTDAATIHSSNAPTNGPGCTPCHRTGTLTLDCTTCHTIDMTPRHAAQDASHTAEPGICVNSACHGSDTGVNVATLHASVPATWTGITPPNCSVCHANPPGPAGPSPSTDCSQCHTDPLTFHNIGTKHHAATGTCVTDGCHGTTADGVDAVALHASGPGCAACHGPGKTPSVVCSTFGCHDSVPATEHAKFVSGATGGKHYAHSSCDTPGCHTNMDIAAVHTAVGCVCHNPGKTLTTTCATVGCHPEGFPAVHDPGLPSHAPTSSTCVSSQCHHNPVDQIHGVAGGPKCAACHAVPAGPAVTARCTSCHIGSLAPSPSSSPSHPTSTTPDSTHTVAPTGCSAVGCHSTNIASIHA